MDVDAKTQHELDVFLAFAKAAHIGIDKNSIENRKPPEPDIRCLCQGRETYFELGRLLDQGMQKLRLKMLKNMPRQVPVDPMTIGVPERDVLRDKISKTYKLNGAPLELLLYFDAANVLVSGGIVADDFPWHAKHVMEPFLQPMPPHIRRVWVYERYRDAVLWCYPRMP